jgi:hypothetical protein
MRGGLEQLSGDLSGTFLRPKSGGRAARILSYVLVRARFGCGRHNSFATVPSSCRPGGALRTKIR